MGGFGWNPSPPKDPLSGSRYPSEETASDAEGRVLIVEDNESDVFLIEKAIAEAKLSLSVHVVRDGQQAIEFFDQVSSDETKPCPDLVILDINLPKRQGGEVLQHMRKSPRCADAHIIVISTSDALRDREQMAQLGADGYFRKPSDFDEFMKLGDLIKSIFGGPE